MPLARITDRSKIVQRITETKDRGLSFVDAPEQFDGPTLFYNDDDTGQMYAFTKRKDFLHWSWMSAATLPTTRQIQSALQLMFADKESEYSTQLPFFAILTERCPIAQNFLIDKSGVSAQDLLIPNQVNGVPKKDTTIVDNLVAAINSINPNTAVKVDPPQPVNLERSRIITVSNKWVWFFTTPFRLDFADDGQKQSFEIKQQRVSPVGRLG